MPFPIILAHGALGEYDELIEFGVAAIFLTLMGISWVKSRNTRPEFEQAQEQSEERDFTETSDEPDRFSLD